LVGCEQISRGASQNRGKRTEKRANLHEEKEKDKRHRLQPQQGAFEEMLLDFEDARVSTAKCRYTVLFQQRTLCQGKPNVRASEITRVESCLKGALAETEDGIGRDEMDRSGERGPNSKMRVSGKNRHGSRNWGHKKKVKDLA